jgi:hypothetical protein
MEIKLKLGKSMIRAMRAKTWIRHTASAARAVYRISPFGFIDFAFNL